MSNATDNRATSQAPPKSVTCIVNLTDGVEDTAEAFFLEIQKTDIDDEKLSDLRSLIVKNTRCVEILQLPFCLASGAVVQDSVSVNYYLTQCLKIDASSEKIEVFLKDESSLAETGWNELVPSYYSSPLTGTNAKHITELEEKQWNAVVETNQLCHGTSVITQDVVTRNADGTSGKESRVVGVQKPKHPAFRLATRKILSDTLASSMVKDVEFHAFSSVARWHVDMMRRWTYVFPGTSTTINLMWLFAILLPRRRSLSQSKGLLRRTFQLQGGGAFGFTVDVSASASVASQTASDSTQAGSKSDVTMSYNFPRVTVFLEETGLELTPKCEQDLRAFRDAASYQRFLKKYGEFFSTTVQLGGSLFATETSEAKTASSREQTAQSMKAAAAVALSGWGYSASVSASHQRQSQEAKGASTASSSRALLWQANGGNTLLCNDPAAWAPSVAYYGNWRVLKQGNVVRLMDVISKLKGFEYVKARLATWKTAGPAVVAPVAQKFTLNAKGTPNGRYLVGRRGLPFGSGSIEMGPKTEKKTAKFLCWELALEKDGTAATKVEYGKDYFLLHCYSKFYPGLYAIKKPDNMYTRLDYGSDDEEDLSTLEPVHEVDGRRSRDFTVRFNDKDGKAKTGDMENGDTVTLEFKHNSKVMGYLASQTAADDNTGVVVTKRTKGYAPIPLTYAEVGSLESTEPDEDKGEESSSDGDWDKGLDD